MQFPYENDQKNQKTVFGFRIITGLKQCNNQSCTCNGQSMQFKLVPGFRFVVDLKNGIYYQKCHDLDCRAVNYKSPGKLIFIAGNETVI